MPEKHKITKITIDLCVVFKKHNYINQLIPAQSFGTCISDRHSLFLYIQLIKKQENSQFIYGR